MKQGRVFGVLWTLGGLLACCRAEQFTDVVSPLVAANGYPLETHSVTTADGYILDMHRIPYGVKSPAGAGAGNGTGNGTGKPVVFLMHPAFFSSYSYVFLGKDHSLAFILADAGYDVWMGNTRGNIYARKNIYVTPNSAPFWQFSLHERGAIDLPTMIDYVLAKTQQEKLSYVSLSRGGTMFFIMASELPQYNNKIKLAVTIAPVAFISKAPNSLIGLLSQTSHLAEWTALVFGIKEFYITPALAELLNIERCRNSTLAATLCNGVFFVPGNPSFKNVNKTRLPDVEKTDSRGMSVKEAAHFAQLVASKRFSKYDYGFVENIGRYGALVAPSYDLSKVTSPVVLISAKEDQIVARSDVEKLAKELPNLVEDIYIEDPDFAHLDFIVADSAKTIAYERILAYLNKYENTV